MWILYKAVWLYKLHQNVWQRVSGLYPDPLESPREGREKAGLKEEERWPGPPRFMADRRHICQWLSVIWKSGGRRSKWTEFCRLDNAHCWLESTCWSRPHTWPWRHSLDVQRTPLTYELWDALTRLPVSSRDEAVIQTKLSSSSSFNFQSTRNE